MGYDVLQEAVKKNKENKKRRTWQQIVTCMAAVVVFCTTYALILPAITMEADLTCETEEHQHTEDCYLEIGGAKRLRCATQEHTHDAILCYADTEADVENATSWEASLPEQLSGVYVNDLLLVAESQLGYSESTRNIIVEEDGTLKGYSRYGAWAGDAYGDWNNYFLSFCLNYAGLDKAVYPQSADYAEWMNLLNGQGLYASVESGYLPQTGDILFVDLDGDGIADRAGLVSGVTTNAENVLVVLTIEGDMGSTDSQVVAVESFMASVDDMDIAAVSDGDATVSGNDSASIITTIQYRTPDDYAGGKVNSASYVMGEANILGFGLLPEDQTYYCGTEGHLHTISCYEAVLNCQVTAEDHVHDSQCYKTGALVCGTEEHAHVEECAVIPTYEYSYSDDKVQVDVKLPQDCGVPANAKLVVTPIETEHESYEGLVQEAEAAVEGTVSKIQFYDISFYTEDNTYIPVDDRATVSLRFTESVVDTNADVVVLHYEEDNTAPVALENVIVEEQAVVAETAPVAEAEAAPFSLLRLFSAEEEAAIAKIDGTATDESASAAEAEAVTAENSETVTETVVTFETDGFSTFAVVEVETGAYKGLVVNPATNPNSILTIDNTNYNTITGFADNKKQYIIVSADMKYALSSYAELDADGEDKLKGMEVLKTETVTETDGTSNDYVYVNANKHLLWEFVGTKQTGQVYIKSVANGEYLQLVRPGVGITTGFPEDNPENRQMIQVFKDNDSDMVGFTVEVDGNFYFLNRNGGGDNYHTWSNAFEGDGNNKFYLVEYNGTTDDAKIPEQYPSVNMPDPETVYMLAGVNYNNQYAGNTNIPYPTVLTDGNSGGQEIQIETTGKTSLMHLTGEVAKEAVYDEEEHSVSYLSHTSNNKYLWLFEETGEENVYKINRMGTGEYLNIGANGLTVAGNQQGIKVEPVAVEELTNRVDAEGQSVNPVVQSDVIRLSAQVDGKTWYVFLNGNVADSEFTAVPTYKGDSPVDEDATHMVMIPYGKLVDGLEGKSYLISGVNNKTAGNTEDAVAQTTAAILTSTTSTAGLPNGQNGLANVNVTKTVVDNGAVTNVSVANAADYAWQFEDEGYGTYRIKSLKTGGYLNIDNGSLTLSTTPQTIEVIVANKTTMTETIQKDVISLRNTEGEYVILYNDELDNAFTGILSTAKDNYGVNRGTQLILTEYKPTTDVSDFATDLGGQVYFVVGVNNNNNSTSVNPPLLATTGDSGTLTGENRKVPISEDDNSVTNVNDTNKNLGWAFIDTEIPGVYYLMAANADGTNSGKYLKIAADGLTMVNGIENASAIEAVKADTTGLEGMQDYVKDAICLRTSINGTYYYINLDGNSRDNNFKSLVNANNSIKDGSNHFILVEIEEVNDVVAQINNLIDNMVLGTTVDSANANEDAEPKEVYQFSDAGWWGASAIDNNNLGQQGGYQGADDLTFVDDYNQAQAYRKEMQEKARAAREAFNNLTEVEKKYVYNSTDLVDKMEWLWRGVQTVDAVDVNATVKLFNYDGTVNETDLAMNGAAEGTAQQGFSFYHKIEYDAYTAIVDANRLRVDKLGGNDTALGMNKMLVDGYPEINDAALANGVSGSLKYLFDNTYQVATMENGGGLFQRDADGYYYYYANQNSAYYNGTVGPVDADGDGIADTTEVKDGGKFVLYDTVVRPMYIDGDQPNGVNDVYNFLPFNNPADSAICDPVNTIPSNTAGATNVVKGIYDSGVNNGKEKVYTGTTANTANRARSAYLNERPDLWFGMTIDFNFVMPASGTVTPPNGGEPQAMIFDFYGDDDVFVYIDDVLVLDIGGVHGAEGGTINFQTGDVTLVSSDGTKTTTTTLRTIFDTAKKGTTSFNTVGNTEGKDADTFQDYSVHTLKFFYMERGGNVSYCGLKFNLPILPDNFLLAEKELKGIAPEKINFDQYYTFRVVQAEVQKDGSYAATGNAFFKPGTTFELWTNGEAAKDANGNKLLGTTDDQGYFSVKNGYAAMFTDVLESRSNTDCNTYIVQEIIPSDEAGQFTSVTNSIITINDDGDSETVGGNGTDKSITPTVENSNQKYTGTHVVAGNNNTVTVNNEVNEELLGELKITKKLATNTTVKEGETFRIKVLLGDDRITAGSGTGAFGTPTTELVPIPVGTKYTLLYIEGDATKTEDKTVTEAGYIDLQVGHTATISGLLAGTKYEVSEALADGQEYTPSYAGVVKLKSNGSTVTETTSATGISGELGVGNIVDITITNADYDFAATVPISKAVTYSGGTDTFTFNVVEDTITTDGTFSSGDSLPGTTITVSPADKLADGTNGNTGNVLIGYKKDDVVDQQEFYYMITEQSGTDYVYDSTRYVVKVVISVTGETYTAAVTGVWTADEAGNLTVSPLTTLAFKNHRTTSVTIKKTVEGRTTSDTFKYTAEVTVPDGVGYELPASDAKFTLKSGESKVISGLPIGSIVTVKEEDEEDYLESYKISAVYEAEYGTLANGARIGYGDEAIGASGEAVVMEIGDSGGTGSVTIPIELVEASNVALDLIYESDADRKFGVVTQHGERDQTEYLKSGSWVGWPGVKYTMHNLALQSSDAITISGADGQYAPNLDYIVVNTGEAEGNTAKINLLGDGSVIEFINKPLTTVTVKKTVEGSDTTEQFAFQYTVTTPDGSNIVATGEFDIGNGGEFKIPNVPVGSIVTVEEVNGNKYNPTHDITTRIEAEDADRRGATAYKSSGSASGDAYIGYIGEGAGNTVTFNVDSITDSKPKLNLIYTSDEERKFEVKVNNKSVISQSFASTNSWTDNWVAGEFGEIELKRKVASAANASNTIVIGNESGATPNLDCIDLTWTDQSGWVATQYVNGETTIEFTNVFYSLPQTGGTGTNSYILGGFITMLSASAALLLYNKQKRRKEENVPS